MNDNFMELAYNEMYKSIGIIKIREAQLVTALNNKFKTEMIRKVYYNPGYNDSKHNSYSFVIEYINDNDFYHSSAFIGEEVFKLKSLKQFKKYLENNRIN